MVSMANCGYFFILTQVIEFIVHFEVEFYSNFHQQVNNFYSK